MADASITADLSLNTAPFSAGFARVRGIISGAGTALGAVLPGVLAVGAAAFAGIAAGAVGVKKALDLGGELSDLSAQTGLAAGELQVLQQAFKNNGMEAEDVGKGINKMQKAIVTGSAVFGQLGIDIAKLRGQSASAQLKTIGAAIDGINNPAEKTAAAMEIFGKSGAKMLTVFADSSALATAAGEVGTQAELLSRDADLFDNVSDKLQLAGLKVQGFFVGVADKVAPVLTPLIDKFINLDLASYGQAIGEGVAFVIQALSDGKLATILGASIKIQFFNVLNFLASGLLAVVTGAGQTFVEMGKLFVEVFKTLTTGEFWSGLGKTLLGIAQSFGAVILDAIASLLEKLEGVPIIGEKLGNAAERFRQGANLDRAWGQQNQSEGADLFGPINQRMAALGGTGLTNVMGSFSDAFKSGRSDFDTFTAPWQKELDDNVASVMANGAKISASVRENTKPKDRQDTYDVEGIGNGKNSTAADSSRRVGLGGVAYSSSADPTTRAVEKLGTKLDRISGLLEKKPKQEVLVKTVSTFK